MQNDNSAFAKLNSEFMQTVEEGIVSVDLKDIEIDESVSSNLQGIQLESEASSESNLKVGYLGEYYAFVCLRQMFADSSQSVDWINQEEETGEWQDIKMEDDKGETKYQEVKSTSTQDLHSFHISPNQMQKALEGDLAIVRVYNVNVDNLENNCINIKFLYDLNDSNNISIKLEVLNYNKG